MKKCARFPSVGLVALSVFACSSEDADTANHDAGAAGAPAGGTSGTTEECATYERTTDLHASCELVRGSCPRTVQEYLEGVVREDGSFPYLDVFEGDGLQEVTSDPIKLNGSSFSFTDDGALAGFRVWNELPSGVCNTFEYQRGRLLMIEALRGSPSSTWVHHCELAPDALETGVLCECPCPVPAPSNGIHENPIACITPACAATFDRQRVIASANDGQMRSGCGVRTLTVEPFACSYDETGNLIGGTRQRNSDTWYECPGVDTTVSGDVPATCAEEVTCYIGQSPPAGSMACPPEG